MTTVHLENVGKSYGQTLVVKGINLTVNSGEFLVLLGPSGCGKSTTLRMVAGLEDVSAGRIYIGGRDTTDEAPSRRGLSMVFQSYALFPHLSVAENIVFGLKVRRVSRAERETRLSRVAAMVGLDGLLSRKPAQLSGGQRQRVALARAVVAEHPLCLMDEPLSNLDAQLRHEMRGEIRALQRRLGMTVVYVTHDQVEAMSMADRVALLQDGQIEQVGPPEDLYAHPASTFVARFIGAPPMNLLRLADGPMGAVIDGDASAKPVARGPGSGLQMGIRPEHIRLGEGVAAVIEAVDYHGADTMVSARIGNQSVLVRVAGRFTVGAGTPVGLSWNPDAVSLFDADGHRHPSQFPFSQPIIGDRSCLVV